MGSSRFSRIAAEFHAALDTDAAPTSRSARFDASSTSVRACSSRPSVNRPIACIHAAFIQIGSSPILSEISMLRATMRALHLQA